MARVSIGNDYIEFDDIYASVRSFCHATYGRMHSHIWDSPADMAHDLFLFSIESDVFTKWDASRSSWKTYLSRRCYHEVRRVLKLDGSHRSPAAHGRIERDVYRSGVPVPETKIPKTVAGDDENELWNIIKENGICLAWLRCRSAGWTRQRYEESLDSLKNQVRESIDG